MEMKIIRFCKMPYCINGYTIMDENGDYNIYINSSMTREKQRTALEHELRHIERNDFDEGKNIEHIEERFHKAI